MPFSRIPFFRILLSIFPDAQPLFKPACNTGQDDHLSIYLYILKRQRDKPSARLTTSGVLEFIAIITNGVLRFEHDGQQSDILSFSTH